MGIHKMQVHSYHLFETQKSIYRQHKINTCGSWRYIEVLMKRNDWSVQETDVSCNQYLYHQYSFNYSKFVSISVHHNTFILLTAIFSMFCLMEVINKIIEIFFCLFIIKLGFLVPQKGILTFGALWHQKFWKRLC